MKSRRHLYAVQRHDGRRTAKMSPSAPSASNGWQEPDTEPPSGAHRVAVYVSVIVRSFQRPVALIDLVGRLLSQRFARFEIVVLEMSDDPSLVATLLGIGDPRLRVVVSRPLDPPAARNAAVAASRGELLVFVDDDDLPIGRDFIARHVDNYADPCCMGVVGRLVGDPSRTTAPKFPRIVRALAMRHTFFGDTVAMAHNTLRKVGIDFLIGSNSSTRRALVDRLGGWDEGLRMHEEQSFAFKFKKRRMPGEYFVFDPKPLLWRRTDIPGGLARRDGADWWSRELTARLAYYREVVGRYLPLRYRWLFPLFFARAFQQTLFWIWDPDNRTRSRREQCIASAELLLSAFRSSPPHAAPSAAPVRAGGTTELAHKSLPAEQ